MNADEIRRTFVEFFVQRGHLHLPGLPLVTNDPNVTTLFTIAGMQQMIPYFMGREQPPSPNMVTVQKAVRTPDIEEVGDDTHLTFLEMLGNFSVGAYFKREAIEYTWTFLTETIGISAERWWAVTYPGDEEARDAWLSVGLPRERIGATEDNWWGPPGSHGPCGPNSEIHYDRGVEFGCGLPECRPEAECCDRFVEIWNDVFMSFYQDENGDRRPLPWNNIDTGMGFERLVTVTQGKQSPYETDLFQPIIQAVSRLAGKPYGDEARADRSLRIIADHCRSSAFIIADGVMPSSDKRGYVLRRLIRRAALHGRLLGLERPFLSAPIAAVITVLGEHHVELRERESHVLEVIEEEEKRFLQTLNRGLAIVEEVADRASAGDRVLSGADTFTLYDTHGFPLELTQELADDRGLRIDRDAFDRKLQEQRERARGHANRGTIGAANETYALLADTLPHTVFTGYDELHSTATVVAIVMRGQSVGVAEAGEQAEIILNRTPFYAESGGQVGDTGTISSDSAEIQVVDTQRLVATLIAHRVDVLRGSIAVGDVVEAEVDAVRRLHILPHHSGTHLLHKALQEVLGSEATQAGSLVAPDRLRFDFQWPRALTIDELREVQNRVNAAIWANLPVRKTVMSYDDAIQSGAMALFGEKYGEHVRVVSMGEWSKELCGGTHVDATGDIGSLLITSEGSVSSGVRRIEAVAGAAAYAHTLDLRDQLSALTQALEARPDTMLQRAESLLEQVREQEKRIERLTRKLAVGEADALLLGGHAVDSMTVVAGQISADSVEYLQAVTDAVKARLDRGIVVLGSVVESKPAFTMAVTRNLTGEGYQANAILRQAAKVAQGGAGGTPEFANGGGRDASKIDDVWREAVTLIRNKAEG